MSSPLLGFFVCNIRIKLNCFHYGHKNINFRFSLRKMHWDCPAATSVSTKEITENGQKKKRVKKSEGKTNNKIFL